MLAVRQTIEASDGTNLSFRVVGKGPSDVMLLHGFGLDGRQWLPAILPHLKGKRFILPDLRGHGHSSGGSYHRDMGLQRLSSDLMEILDSLNIETCALGAYSMGAVVGLDLLSRDDKRRFHSYLHIEASPCFHHHEDWPYGFSKELMEPASQLVEHWDSCQEAGLPVSLHTNRFTELLRILAKESFPTLMFKHFFGVIPHRVFRRIPIDLNFVHEFFAFLLFKGFDHRPHIAQLDMPALLLSGRQSTFFPWESQAWMQRHWLRSEHRIYEHSGHGLVFSEPIKFQRDFHYFLNHLGAKA